MTEQDMISKVKSGEALLVGEWRNVRAETIHWRDKVSQTRREGITIAHSVECGDRTVTVAEFAPDNMKDVSEYKHPFKKGNRVVVRLQSLVVERGQMTVRGQIEVLTA